MRLSSFICLGFLCVGLVQATLPLHVSNPNRPSKNRFYDLVRDFVSSYPNRTEIAAELEEVIAQASTPVKLPTQPADVTYWWYFPKTDCGYDDVSGSCQGQSVTQCQSTCLNTPGCGGFNYPHGVLKKTVWKDCYQHKSYEETVDLYVIGAYPQPSSVPFPPFWPYPQAFTNGSSTVSVASQGFKFTSKTSSPDLDAAYARYTLLFFPHVSTLAAGSGILNEVIVSVSNVSGELQLETDESYELNIPSDGSAASITAPTVFGAMHGLETLSQLIMFDFSSKTYKIANSPWSINDYPRFKHREVLLDSSRHFLPVQTLFNMIDSLTYAKINVVHWHIVDSQSFPFDSPSRPLLINGAYSAQERYSTDDCAAVVEYARQRGVRIMVEIDNPGHAGSWCAGYPGVCPSPTCLEPLNPAADETWDVITDLWADITGRARGAGLFYDNMFHLGGDEVDTTCWTSTPSINQWLQQNNLTADGGYEYFVNRSQSIARGFGRDVVGWEEIWDHFGTELDPSTIIHQWLPGSTIAQNATSYGYRVLWSTDGVWYLDGLDVTWQTMYIQEPCTGIDPATCAKYVLGGGGEMWGETVDTSDLQSTVWPRLAAIAERLWSPQSITDPAPAEARFAAFRCLLNRRGVAAAPYNNPEAREAPPGPGGCYMQ